MENLYVLPISKKLLKTEITCTLIYGCEFFLSKCVHYIATKTYFCTSKNKSNFTLPRSNKAHLNFHKYFCHYNIFLWSKFYQIIPVFQHFKS